MALDWDRLTFLLVPLVEAALVVALSILPGWFLTKGLRRDPLARLLAAIVASYTLLYLLEFGAYVVSGPAWLPPVLALLLASVSLAQIVRGRGDGGERFPWRAALAWFGLVSWLIALQSFVVAYGAASWFGDWYEHYERTIFFVDQLPPTTRFLLNLWTLPARGPAFNASAAIFLVIFGKSFWVYQIVATVLNSFLVIPLALLVRDVGRVEESKALLISAVLLAVAPFAVAQETVTWTKFFTGGLFLAGVYFYLRSPRDGERQALGWSMASFTLGVLSHYLIIPMAAPFGVHALYSVVRKRLPVLALLYPTAACALLLATWFVYSIAVFGVRGTVTAHTAFNEEVQASLAATQEAASRSQTENFVGNVVATLVPSSLRHDLPALVQSPLVGVPRTAGDRWLPPEAKEARAREEWLADLVNNADSVAGELGLAGIAALLYVAWARGRSRRDEAPPDAAWEGPGSLFWLLSAFAVLAVFAWTAHLYAPHGLAHVGLQPYVLLVAVFLVRRLRGAPPYVSRALVALFLIESAVSTAALLALQSRVLPISVSAGGVTQVARVDANPTYVQNYILKLENGATFLADVLADTQRPFALLAASIAAAVLAAGLVEIRRRGRAAALDRGEM